ncbi:restriction endonuclease [Cohnella massiliensis]|uniref:restriction endonuclease n=1 Tax=Cohnella massiliensis TaxID=1816691 RepID=UPI000A6A877B|nr:restriction endonuclease [Cohnella massiliensis]
MDGYDFERLITQLLRSMGFLVEMTSLSGDGGVDIIAYSDQPIIKGKYLVQCKRWNAAIGEPTVRDLYGVVLSQNANKGIIITNSTFSDKAVEFADNKNIELIDGSQLAILLNQYCGTADIAVSSIRKRFDEIDEFELDKYKYLKSRIENNRNEKQHYDLLRDFYHSYILRNEIEINKAGLLDEYIKFNEEFIQRFCKRSKLLLEEKKAVQYINGVLYLLKGDLFKSVEIYKDLQLFDPNSMNILLHRYQTVSEHFSEYFKGEIVRQIENTEYGFRRIEYIGKTTNNLPSVILKNLYLVFSKIQFKTGTDYIEQMIESRYQENMQSDRFTAVGKAMQKLMYEDIQSTFQEIREGQYKMFNLPLKYSVGKESSYSGYIGNYYYHLDFSEDSFMTVDQLVEEYWGKSVSEDEIAMLEVLFK